MKKGKNHKRLSNSIKPTPKANTQGTTIKAELDSIKNKNQPITNAIQEVGTVPGNGLTSLQVSNTMAEYQNQYLDFVKSTIEPKINDFARDKKIAIVNDNVRRENLIWVSLRRIGDDSEGILTLSSSTEGLGSKIWSNYKDGQNCEIKFNHDSIKGIFLQFITQQLYSDNLSDKSGKKNSDTFTIEKFIANLREFRRRPEFPQILLQKDIKESNLTEECEYSIKTTPDSIEHEAQATNSSAAATTVLGFTTLLTTIFAPIVNNTTPAISNQNSTSITNDSSIATGTPEQDDHTDIGTYYVIAGGVLLAVMACILAVHCHYKNYRKRHISGTYNVQGAPECISTSQEQEYSYTKFDEVNKINVGSNKRPLATIKEEGELLLPDQGQSGSGISIPDNTSTGMQQPGPSGVKQAQAVVHKVEECVDEPHVKKRDKNIDSQTSKRHAMTSEQFDELKNKNLGKGVAIPLHAITNTTVTNVTSTYQQNFA